MYLENIVLRHFRNYKELNLRFTNTINIFLGENAQGKTNLLESILVLALAKSHRTTNDKDFIEWNGDFAKIEGRVAKKHHSIPLELTITKKGKKAKINHIEQKKLSQYVGELNTVMFSPEDLSLIKGAPSLRRRFLNMEIGQMQPLYLYNLSQYQRILHQRNQFLKQAHLKKEYNETLFDILNEQFAEIAVKLMAKRRIFIEKLEKYAAPIHFEISQGKEALHIKYKPSVELLSSTFKEEVTQFIQKMQSIKSREIDRGITLIGPHRDDSLFYINEQDIQAFSSQGQQRTAALSIKLAEIDLIYEETGEYPLLLLDDVLSELDDYRQSHLLEAIAGKVQTFVTTTNITEIVHKTLRQATIFKVDEGKVEKIRFD